MHPDEIRNLLLLKAHMKHFKILGTGCANCDNTAKLIETTAQTLGVPMTLEKITDIAQILGYGVMSTPGVILDGKVVHAGGVPDQNKVAAWLGNNT